MQPNSPTPGCTCQISQRWTQKGTIKISPNKTLQSLFINVAASPKIHVPVTSAIICFNQSIRVTLRRIQKPLREKGSIDQKHAKTNEIWRQNSEIHSPFAWSH